MIPAEYYQTIYLLLILFCTIPVCNKYNAYSQNRLTTNIKKNSRQAFLLTLMMIFFIGFRPISDFFADMPGYAYAMTDHRYEYIEYSIQDNFLFYPMMAFLSSHNAPERLPIVLLAIINFGSTFFAMRKWFPKDSYAAMLVFFGAFSTFGAATNGLKAGCAAGIFLCALAYKDELKICIPLLILSLGFHHSMQLPVCACIACLFFRNTKVFFAFWFFSLLMAAAHVTTFQMFFADFVDEHNASYLIADSDNAFITGFRPDFVLYSSMPVLVGLYCVYKRKIEISENYVFLLNLYLLINAMWMLTMHASFTNRIAYLSWLMYPIVLIYPYLQENWGANQYKIFSKVCMAHLAFTLFMHFIYY